MTTEGVLSAGGKTEIKIANNFNTTSYEKEDLALCSFVKGLTDYTAN